MRPRASRSRTACAAPRSRPPRPPRSSRARPTPRWRTRSTATCPRRTGP
jgi:hypothetical protein